MSNSTLTEFDGEVMKLVSEYGRANRNMSTFSPEEQDLAWAAVDAAYERILHKLYGRDDIKRVEWEMQEISARHTTEGEV